MKREGLIYRRMKNKGYKFILMTLLPVLLLVLSPMRVMVCKMEMAKCPPCCHEMSVKKSASEVQVSSVNDCCIIHASEGFTAITPLQKNEDISKKKFQSLVSAVPHFSSYALQSLTNSEVHFSHSSVSPPQPPLILIKSSFLI